MEQHLTYWRQISHKHQPDKIQRTDKRERDNINCCWVTVTAIHHSTTPWGGDRFRKR